MHCEVAHFYNYKLHEVRELDHIDFYTLYYGMHRIIAKNMLNDFTTNDFPNLQNKSRKEIHKKIYKIAHPENFTKKVLKTTDLELV